MCGIAQLAEQENHNLYVRGSRPCAAAVTLFQFPAYFGAKRPLISE